MYICLMQIYKSFITCIAMYIYLVHKQMSIYNIRRFVYNLRSFKRMFLTLTYLTHCSSYGLFYPGMDAVKGPLSLPEDGCFYQSCLPIHECFSKVIIIIINDSIICRTKSAVFYEIHEINTKICTYMVCLFMCTSVTFWCIKGQNSHDSASRCRFCCSAIWLVLLYPNIIGLIVGLNF